MLIQVQIHLFPRGVRVVGESKGKRRGVQYQAPGGSEPNIISTLLQTFSRKIVSGPLNDLQFIYYMYIEI
jgi:hypothetical protein